MEDPMWQQKMIAFMQKKKIDFSMWIFGVLEMIGAALLSVLIFTTYRREQTKSWTWSFLRKLKSSADSSEKPEKKTVRDIPGPATFPVIGTTWMYYSIVGKYQMSQIHLAYADMNRMYGPLCKEESLWNHPVISVFDRTFIETILKRPSKFPLRPPQEIISYYRKSRADRYTNTGLVNEQGETWQKLRATLTPELTGASTVLGFFPALNGVTDDFIDLIRNQRTGCDDVIGFEELAYRMGLESTCTLMLGRKLGFLNPKSGGLLTNKLADAVRHHFVASRDAFYGFPFWKVMPTRTYKELIDCEDVIYNIISELVETTLEESKGDAQDEDIEAVFKSILREKSLDIRDKKAAIIDFIAAGIHTVGNTLVFLLHTIGRNPEVQARLREEASSLVPPRCDITAADLQNAKYVRAFIEEVFRLTPTTPCIARILDQPVDLGDYHIDAGSVVVLHTWVAGLNEKNFTKPTECIPERWIEPKSYTPHSPSMVVPFGFGRRICPGKRFVNHALQLMVTKIVREFEITAPEEMDITFEFILAPKGPITLNLRDVHSTS